MKRIAIVSPTFLPTMAGTEVEISEIAKRLAKCYDLTLIIPSDYIVKLQRSGISLPYKTIKIPSILISLISRLNGFKFLQEMLTRIIGTFINKQRYDVICCYFAYPTYRTFGIKYVSAPALIIPQGVDVQIEPSTNYGFALNPQTKEHIKEALRNANKIFYMGDAMLSSILKLGPPSRKLQYCPTATNLEKIDSVAVPLKKKPLLKILTAARNDPKKNLVIIPQVVEQLVNQGFNNFEWTIIGEGVINISFHADRMKHIKLLDVIKPTIDEASLPPTELIVQYKTADLFVLPSLIEGMSLTLLDVMAARTPILAGDTSGISEHISPESSIVADIRSPQSIANRIIDFYHMPDKQKITIIDRARDIAEQYSWEHVTNIYKNVIENIQ